MSQPRSQLVDPTQAGTFHCVNRCVRRSWLCGLDKYLGKSFEHRRAWVEARILELGDIFACGIHAWVVMSNHLHIVVHMSPATANSWSPEEVATRWIRLYPARNLELCAQKMAAILENPELIAEYRSRLANLSWLMKSLSEPIARKANAEDKVTGRFWEGRFGCQALLSEKSTLAAMTYVDLNPVRAKIASDIATARYTSVKLRNQRLRKNPERANQPLMPLIGARSFNLPSISAADYIELVDFTGRELHPGKRGKIEANEPKALTKLGLDNARQSTAIRTIN